MAGHNDTCSLSSETLQITTSFDRQQNVLSTSPNSSASANEYASSPISPSPLRNTNTFVHKLFAMVNDKMYEHLIHWTGNGSSFTVENVTDFSKEVLPKHFKHNNFASFVRQLNMYGFHKVNKAPRGVKMSQENQIWEFSHPKFQYNRPDLLEEIKRKNVDTDTIKRDSGDMAISMSYMQQQQNALITHVQHLQNKLDAVTQELQTQKARTENQQNVIRNIVDFLQSQYQNQFTVPSALSNFPSSPLSQPRRPSLLVTTPDGSNQIYQGQSTDGSPNNLLRSRSPSPNNFNRSPLVHAQHPIISPLQMPTSPNFHSLSALTIHSAGTSPSVSPLVSPVHSPTNPGLPDLLIPSPSDSAPINQHHLTVHSNLSNGLSNDGSNNGGYHQPSHQSQTQYSTQHELSKRFSIPNVTVSMSDITNSAQHQNQQHQQQHHQNSQHALNSLNLNSISNLHFNGLTDINQLHMNGLNNMSGFGILNSQFDSLERNKGGSIISEGVSSGEMDLNG